MKTQILNPILFDVPVVAKKSKGNSYHDRNGRFTNKYISRAERAEKRAEIAEKQLLYISSCYHSIGRQFAELSRKYNELKTKNL